MNELRVGDIRKDEDDRMYVITRQAFGFDLIYANGETCSGLKKSIIENDSLVATYPTWQEAIKVLLGI